MREKLSKMCLWNTNASDNGQFKDDEDHKDKSFDTSRKILSQEIIIWIVEALTFIFFSLEVMTNAFFVKKKCSNVKVKRLCSNRMLLHVSQGIFLWYIKDLALIVEKLLARLEFQTDSQNDRMTEWQTAVKKIPVP